MAPSSSSATWPPRCCRTIPLTGQERLVVRHDPTKLGRALRTLLHDYALQAQLSVSRAIFREYDIRGIVGSELTTTALESHGPRLWHLHAAPHRATPDHPRP
jgi:hypothetical protein